MRKLLPSIQGEKAVLLSWKEVQGFYTTGSSMFLVTVSWQSQDSLPPQNYVIQPTPTAPSPAPDSAPTPICELLSCTQGTSP